MSSQAFTGKSVFIMVLFFGYSLGCLTLTWVLSHTHTLTVKHQVLPAITAAPVSTTPTAQQPVTPDTTTRPKPELPPPAPTITRPDFAGFSDVKEKKQAFFNYLAPMVEKENRRIVHQRHRLLNLQDAFEQHGSLTRREQDQLAYLADQYNLPIEDRETKDVFAELRKRIDQIPPAMALAQAAEESAWGTSRFARRGNNFFGQWCYRKGCGIVPLQQREGAYYEVAKYTQVDDSVHAYFRNINTNRAYRNLRSQRAGLRDNGEPIKASRLITGLSNYSERGQVYIDTLQSIIRANNLDQYTVFND